MPTPRVFIVRHGETEWSLNGRHTGSTDIPLTQRGERRIRATAAALVGDDRLIVPGNLAAVYVSPRRRARRTLELLGIGDGGGGGGGGGGDGGFDVQVREDVREWEYGDYEGVTSAEIAKVRKEKGLGEWDIWRDGCPGGESPQQVTARLDAVIGEIRSRFHAPAFAAASSSSSSSSHDLPCDVLVVAHGHILRALAGRWINEDIADNPSLLLEAGGVGTLSYEHHALDQPAILLGGAFVVEEEKEKGKEEAS